jgi:hypothetical protein
MLVNSKLVVSFWRADHFFAHEEKKGLMSLNKFSRKKQFKIIEIP